MQVHDDQQPEYLIDDEDEGDVTEENSSTDSAPIRALREANKRLEKELANLRELQKENAILKAGLDTENPYADLFIKAYDGEWTAEAVREAAGKYPGLIPGVEQESAEELAEQQAHRRVVAAGTDAPAAPEGKKAWEDAQTPEEFLRLYEGQVVVD